MSVESKIKTTFEQERDKANKIYDNVKNETENVYQQFKDSACHMYEEGRKKVSNAQDYLEGQSKELKNAVKDMPLTSLIIAGGIGYLLSLLMKK